MCVVWCCVHHLHCVSQCPEGVRADGESGQVAPSSKRSKVDESQGSR